MKRSGKRNKRMEEKKREKKGGKGMWPYKVIKNQRAESKNGDGYIFEHNEWKGARTRGYLYVEREKGRR